ncbi:hypothetical protein BCV69DRAFT_298987 [Microstroma glucosiphilum]|uniref:Telomere length regulation protein conserved domain-containing protein n=1 Tax=Pseudomicrostroma glucosiphilum TaxID=1684307 RepID=A0A316U8P1_9BASI|nr:hypothetical protein BCV69DRAFT_298987 [Pseudomicrostroma glucosiphilum]PWN21214.1 hypothetical protein BCV69DRAFT_298987 [Pseudomicrostroma glucosiphilum]
MQPPHTSARSIQSAARAQLAAPLPSQDALLDILIPTLDLLHLLPEQEVPHLICRKHAAAKVYGIKDDELDDEFRIAFRGRSWLQDVQQAILGSIARDWAPRLAEDGLWEPLLRSWFAPQVSLAAPQRPSAGLISVIEELEDAGNSSQTQVSAALVTASGMQVFISTLSRLTVQEGGAAASPISPILAESIPVLISHYARADFPLLDSLMIASLSEQNLARQKLVWQESMQAMLSLPSRIANALQGDVPQSITTSTYSATLALQLAEQVARLAEPHSSDGRSGLLSQLLSRLLRAGQVTNAFWEVMTRSIFQAANGNLTWPAPYGRAWQKVLASLDDTDRKAFDQNLLAFLDQRIRLEYLQGLVTDQERGKPVLVGQSFLGADVARMLEVQTRLLVMLWGGNGQAADRPESSVAPEDDDDDDDLAAYQRVRSYMLDEPQQYSPVMARTFAAVLLELDPQGLDDALFEAVDVWANAARVKRSTAAQEQYLATLIICLLAEIKQSPQPSNINIGQTLTRRKEFVEGVAAHMSHLDPHIRLMGMLLAELASEASQSEGKGESGSKKLEFGRTLWDGVGNGKEEARVLRALFHSWKVVAASATEVTAANALECLGLVEDEKPGESSPLNGDNKQPKERDAPATRRLPERRSAATSNPAKAKPSMLISELNDSDDEVPILGRATVESESEASSSSESDSSDDDDGPTHDGFAEPDMPLDASSFKQAGKGAGQRDEEETFELDTRKRRRAPVYIWELASLLREKDRDAVRVGLKSAEALIRRKSGWGGEVDENCVDLAFVLVGLQNNYRLKHFDERRTSALQALVVASPRLAAGAIIEQFFTDSWSILQRFAILNALAAASRELAGATPLPGVGAGVQTKQGKAIVGQQQSQGAGVTALASSLADVAISRAKHEGEERVPEIKREKALKLTSQSSRNGNGRSGIGIEEVGTGTSSSLQLANRNGHQSSAFSSLPGTLTRPREKYIDLAGSVFLFPLLTRLSAHIRETSSRFSRLSSSASGGAGTRDGSGVSLGLGSGITIGLSSLFDPQILSALLDTLSVLAHSARNASDFLALLAPEVMEVALLVATRALPLSLAGAGAGAGTDGGEGGGDLSTMHLLHGSCLSLLLVILDASFFRDEGRTLLRFHARPLLEDVGEFAAGVFERVEGEGGERGGGRGVGLGGGGGRGGEGVSRAARCSAAVVLRIEEMRSRWREERMRGL